MKESVKSYAFIIKKIALGMPSKTNVQNENYHLLLRVEMVFLKRDPDEAGAEFPTD